MDPPLAAPAEAARILASIHSTPSMTRYTLTMAAVSMVAEMLGLALAWALLASGLSRRIGRWATTCGRKTFVAGALFWIVYRGIRWLVFFPLALYANYRMPHLYGLSNQPLLAWFGDRLKGLLTDAAIGAVVAGAFLWSVRRWPVRWPLVFAAIATVLSAFLVFVTPIAIDPMFNKFTPLPLTSPLRPGIESLARRAGIPDATIFVVDKSRQTNETNAYVTGLGSTKRIVIWDTLIRKAPQDQLDAIVAHEIGHYVERHVLIGFVVMSAAFFLVLPLIRFLSLALLARWGERWGASVLHDPTAIPAVLLVVSVLGIAAAPINAAASRMIEHRADSFGLALCRDRTAMARAFIGLSRDNLSLPDPPAWIALLEDHPTLRSRAEYALYGKPSQLWPIPPMLPERTRN
ncbi:MAG: M48 family metallopeptidase [Capsulimonadaceae bacterium]|nr:M48 family metallopeptidase [Capsulimonadaceae bacterium]